MSGILFDARWIRPGMTGVGNFAYQILQAMPSGGKVGIILPIGSPYADEFKRFRVFFSRVDLKWHPWTELFEQFTIPTLCYRHGYRNFVSFENRVPICHPGIKTFSFIYDLSFLRIKGSHNIKYSAFLYINMKIAKHFATRIVTISKAVKQDMMNALNVHSEKIIVVYPADSRLNRQIVHHIAVLSKPFFLATGMTNRRKNLANLLRAFMLFNGKDRLYQLAITGNREWIAELCQKMAVPDAVNLGFVNEGELRFLYEGALGLIYPSLDEGFGIPLLDALQFNCPVICSDIPVFREVMDDCALYFDPTSCESIASGLEISLSRHEFKNRARILEKFSWEKSARHLLEEIANVSKGV